MPCVTSAIQSTGRKSIEFIRSTQTNTVSAAGAMKLPRSPCLKMLLACSSTKLNSSSTNAWRLLGTPDVAPRTIHQMKPTPTNPSRIATAIESKCNVQKPPSPTWCAPCVRWWPMYSVGVSSLSVAIVADKKSHRKNEDRYHERSDACERNDVLVGR